jgi:hypothetical protein
MKKTEIFFIVFLIVSLLFSALLALVFLNSYLAKHEKPIQWQRFTSREGNFSILMLGKSWHSEERASDSEMHFDSSILRPDFFRRYFSSVVYRDLEKNKEGKTFEDRAKDGLGVVLGYRKGKLISTKEIKMDGSPGLEARFSVRIRGFWKLQFMVRIFEFSDKIYYLAYGEGHRFSFAEEINLDRAEEFFNSFELSTPEKSAS